ncbi:MAG: hypothetical protein K0S28_1326 [Paucimonas sp.]|nr:hypothetical protein [Paucimonas sp.]
MLKFLFWLLLFANGALFAYHQGYLNKIFPDGREPARLSRQLNADKLTRITADAAPAAAEKVAATATAPAALPEGSAGTTNTCVQIGTFDAAEAKRIQPRLAALVPAERISERPVQDKDTARHIVMIPPLGSKEAADKKAGELKRFGVSDFFVIQDNSPLRWAISLGVFKSEEAANTHLASLREKGVRSARIAPFGQGTVHVVFRLNDVDAATRSALEKLKADFPNQAISPCEPAR